MAGIAQLVRALDCDSRCRRFKSGYPPHLLVILAMMVMFFTGCTKTIISQEYPDDKFIDLLKRQNTYVGEQKPSMELKKDKIFLKKFNKLTDIIKREYGIEKIDRKEYRITSRSNKNNIQVTVFTIDKNLFIVCVNTKFFQTISCPYSLTGILPDAGN